MIVHSLIHGSPDLSASEPESQTKNSFLTICTIECEQPEFRLKLLEVLDEGFELRHFAVDLHLSLIHI